MDRHTQVDEFRSAKAPLKSDISGATFFERTKNFFGHEPIFLPILLRLTPLGTSRQITPATDLVIEGFPRSGNTFTTFGSRARIWPRTHDCQPCPSALSDQACARSRSADGPRGPGSGFCSRVLPCLRSSVFDLVRHWRILFLPSRARPLRGATSRVRVRRSDHALVIGGQSNQPQVFLADLSV